MIVFGGRIGRLLPTAVEAEFHKPATGASSDRMKGREKFRRSNSLSLWLRPGRRGRTRAAFGMVALPLRRQCADHSTDHPVILGKRSPGSHDVPIIEDAAEIDGLRDRVVVDHLQLE